MPAFTAPTDVEAAVSQRYSAGESLFGRSTAITSAYPPPMQPARLVVG